MWVLDTNPGPLQEQVLLTMEPSLQPLYLLTYVPIYFMCMDVMPACRLLYHVCSWCPQKTEVASDPLGLELWMVLSHRECWEGNQGPLQRQ